MTKAQQMRIKLAEKNQNKEMRLSKDNLKNLPA